MYTLYVGAPNDTHEINELTMEQIKSTTSKYFESYTYVKARGVYKEIEEDMVMIVIAKAKKDEVYSLGKELCSFLKQDGVAVEHNGVYEQLMSKQ